MICWRLLINNAIYKKSMEFLCEVSGEEFQNLQNLEPQLDPLSPFCKYYWVTVTEEDFLKKIHILVQGTQEGTWECFSTESCLGCYSQKVYASNYQLPEEKQQKYPNLQTKYFDEIKQRVERFSREEMLLTPLWYKADKKTGPYMIRESMRRHIAAYIHYFILKKETFKPISNNAICQIPSNWRIIPTNFC